MAKVNTGIANHYVSTSEELQSALTEAQDNAMDDVIHIAQGTYVGNFVYASTEENDLSILGGYSSDFSLRDVDATNTVLDGNYGGRVLTLTATDSVASVGGITLVNGYTVDDGGGARIDSNYLTFTNNIVSNNESNGSTNGGGGLYLSIGSWTDRAPLNTVFSDNVISGNIAKKGGGVFILDGNTIFENNTIENNSGNSGGGIYVIHNNIEIINNVFTGNTGYGSGLYLKSYKADLVNNLVVSNNGTGVYFDSKSHGGEINLSNNTITDDINLILNSTGSSATLVNNILYNSTVIDDDKNGDSFFSTVILSNNSIATISTKQTIDIESNNVVGQEPLFVDAANSDYRLSSDSPLIDQGAATDNVTSTDLDGNTRIVGSAIDIGAYEYNGVQAWNPLTNETVDYDKDSVPDGWLTYLPISWDDLLNSSETRAVAWTEINGEPYQSDSEFALYSNGLMASINIDTQEVYEVVDWEIDDKSFSRISDGVVSSKNYLLEYTDDSVTTVVVDVDSNQYVIAKVEHLDRPEYFVDSDGDLYADIIDPYIDNVELPYSITPTVSDTVIGLMTAQQYFDFAGNSLNIEYSGGFSGTSDHDADGSDDLDPAYMWYREEREEEITEDGTTVTLKWTDFSSDWNDGDGDGNSTEHVKILSKFDGAISGTLSNGTASGTYDVQEPDGTIDTENVSVTFKSDANVLVEYDSETSNGTTDTWADKTIFISAVRVTEIAGVPVGDSTRDVYKVKIKSQYGAMDGDNFVASGSGYEGTGWDSSSDNITELVQLYIDNSYSASGGGNTKLVFAPNGKFTHSDTGNTVEDVSWNIVGNVLQVRAYDDYDLKLENGKFIHNWIGDMAYAFTGVTKTEANAILKVLVPDEILTVDSTPSISDEINGGSMGDLSVSVKSWKGMTNLHGVDFGGGKMTGMDGLASFTKDSASPNMDFTPEWMMTTAEQEQADAAVDLQDAISILKMIVGLPINSSGAAVSPYQSIAADFDADGSVGLNDAIDVLKHVVGLPAVGQPKWDFVGADITVDNPLQPGQMAATMTRDVSAINTVELIGVLRGDVDGSWDDLVV